MSAPVPKQRIDQLLVERGFAESREKAKALVLAGQVFVGGARVDKAGQSVPLDSEILIPARLRYVGRGGLKLERALEHFHIGVEARVCIDIGASTGGFTDALLQRGAARVYAIDVGSGQLDWKLRNDSRVVVREKLNARYLVFEDVGEFVDFIACDVSFISATLVMPAFVPLLKPDGEFAVLVKPQFEVGRGEVGKGGIVRDPSLHQAACRKVEAEAMRLGFRTDVIESPILGAEGNKEFLLYARH
ncbi:MAG TPA: TlyA family RNA methyltransferase [Bryobacteraceae bacterium]|nr:TlyA family RNA methyltransferase [Bryobacteraceae bacterium]